MTILSTTPLYYASEGGAAVSVFFKSDYHHLSTSNYRLSSKKVTRKGMGAVPELTGGHQHTFGKGIEDTTIQSCLAG